MSWCPDRRVLRSLHLEPTKTSGSLSSDDSVKSERVAIPASRPSHAIASSVFPHPLCISPQLNGTSAVVVVTTDPRNIMKGTQVERARNTPSALCLTGLVFSILGNLATLPNLARASWLYRTGTFEARMAPRQLHSSHYRMSLQYVTVTRTPGAHRAVGRTLQRISVAS